MHHILLIAVVAVGLFINIMSRPTGNYWKTSSFVNPDANPEEEEENSVLHSGSLLRSFCINGLHT
jgi:hypothetical protein